MGPRLLRPARLLSLAKYAKGRVLQEFDGSCRSSSIHYSDFVSILPALNQSLRHMHTENRGMLGTTVLCVRKDNKVIIIGDGQVTLGNEIIKPNVRKVRRLGANVIGGFAGGTADSFTLFERLETKLEEHSGNVWQLTRAAVELAKAWRTDKFLRRLDAVMVVADAEISLTITGNGDVLEPYDGVIGIGSGGSYASAAARALIDLPDWGAEAIAKKAMKIAADCCIYTNHNFTIEQIEVAHTRSSEVIDQAASLSSTDPCTTST
uniref:HslU--HslV peptidase n=2 Tax=Physcomitrium patens TaxID=3218 RepID=A0A2K1JH17_PHYPA|nr:hypothetical protein PHYPA_018258 [Physcomitrium patens]